LLSGVSVLVVLSLSPAIASPATVFAEGSSAPVSGLSQGARGDAVKLLQQALVDRGVQVSGGVDGVFGPGTAAAVKQFQSSKGLSVSGSVDEATALALGLVSSPYLDLAQGARSDAVKSLQQRLLDLGVQVSGGADGIFGAGTAAAVKAFQAGRGLASTGVVDVVTAAALGNLSPTGGPAPVAPAPAPAPAAPQPAAQPAAPEAPSVNPLVGLKVGARGDAVKTLQGQLKSAGFATVGRADGIFGALTANALASFQTSAGLAANAVVDDATVAALAQASSSSGGQSGGSTGVTSPLLGLAVGSRGDAVRTLQTTLIAAGASVRGGADGVFGSATRSALERYQQGAGLAVSGTVDEATASALASGKSLSGGSAGLLGLTSGSLGSGVKALQEALIAAGVTVRGGADGIYGPATSQAVSAFQTSQGLAVTGKVDEATAAALANPKTPAAPQSPATGGFAVFGEKGARVSAVQAALVNAGLTIRGGVDGDFGPGTSAAVMDFQRARGLKVTGRVDDATAAALGLTLAEAPAAPDPATVQIAVFPVQGRCYFGDSFGYARSGGRTHLGVDIIAPSGKLLYAAADGTITKVYADYPGSLSGNGLRITMADGTYFFYAHLTGLADGIEVGTKVTAGQIVGTVGSTGNSGTSHLHFEVHPQGGSAVNPYPIVKVIDGCNTIDPLPQP
jgi:peptidoglycan hydrolase-like protein with peptidoglycan-binding domain